MANAIIDPVEMVSSPSSLQSHVACTATSASVFITYAVKQEIDSYSAPP